MLKVWLMGVGAYGCVAFVRGMVGFVRGQGQLTVCPGIPGHKKRRFNLPKI